MIVFIKTEKKIVRGVLNFIIIIMVIHLSYAMVNGILEE